MSDTPHFNPFLDTDVTPSGAEAKQSEPGSRVAGDSGQRLAAASEMMGETLTKPNQPAPKLMDEFLDNGQLVNPQTGEVVDPANLDHLLESLQWATHQRDAVYAFRCAVLRRLVQITDEAGDKKKGRRLVGSKIQVKLNMPLSTQDQEILKEAWHAYPQLRDEYLKVATLSVKLTPFKKIMAATISDKKLETFIGMIKKSDKGPSPNAMPSVTFENKLTPPDEKSESE